MLSKAKYKIYKIKYTGDAKSKKKTAVCSVYYGSELILNGMLVVF